MSGGMNEWMEWATQEQPQPYSLKILMVKWLVENVPHLTHPLEPASCRNFLMDEKWAFSLEIHPNVPSPGPQSSPCPSPPTGKGEVELTPRGLWFSWSLKFMWGVDSRMSENVVSLRTLETYVLFNLQIEFLNKLNRLECQRNLSILWEMLWSLLENEESYCKTYKHLLMNLFLD